MAGWYSKFTKNYLELVVPLNSTMEGLEKAKKLIWNEEAVLSFQNIKQVLHQLPCLETSILLNHSLTEASNFAVGGVFTQGEGDEEHVIAYTSRVLNKA